MKGEPENLMEVNKKLRQISLKPRGVGEAIGLYDDYEPLKDPPTSHVAPRTRNATPELMTEEENNNTQVFTRTGRIRSGTGGWGEHSTESDPDEEPVCPHVKHSMETPEEIETYAQSHVWSRLAVGTVTAWWNELMRGRKCREVLERYGWMLGVTVVTVSIALAGWWIRRANQVPEGFVERGSPQWFRSRLHHGRMG